MHFDIAEWSLVLWAFCSPAFISRALKWSHRGITTGWQRWPSTCLSGHVWHWPPHLPAYYCLWRGTGGGGAVAGVYRLVLDGQLLCLAVDQRPNNGDMRGTLPASSCHPVACPTITDQMWMESLIIIWAVWRLWFKVIWTWVCNLWSLPVWW